MKHPLARALASVGLTRLDVATHLQVDPKTVDKWFAGRVPYPRHRTALAKLTGWSSADLWPSTRRTPAEHFADEVRVTYAHRSAVASDTWHRLFASAEGEIGILAYSGLFLAEDATALRTLRDKARAGVRVRIALGDPESDEVARRGADEGLDDGMAAKIRNALVLYRPMTNASNVEIRLHNTVLYSSIYLADDQVLVNPHVYGEPASHAPTLLLHCRHADAIAATYAESFERVWEIARCVG